APLNQWTHVAVVYDKGNVKTYINGRQAHAYAGAGRIGSVQPDANHLRVGGRQDVDQWFHGLIDETLIYNRPLNADEVAAFVPEVPRQLLAHWPFDEGSGATAADATGNGNTGTLQGGAIWTSGRFGGGLRFDGVDDYVQINNSASLEVGKNGADFSIA